MPPVSLTPNASPLEKGGVMLVSWLVPGAGYAIKRDWRLFLANFLLIQGTMLIGLIVFKAGVITPELDRASQEFSLINVLMYVGQLLNGVLAVASAVGMQGDLHFWGARPEIWQSDLGTFYLLVAGALNVFVLFGIWDRYYSRQELDLKAMNEVGSRAGAAPAADEPADQDAPGREASAA